MNKDEALKMAIEALESFEKVYGDTDLLMPHNFYKSLKACKEALEQPAMTYEDGFAHGYEAHRAEQALEQSAQEPVAWIYEWEDEKAVKLTFHPDSKAKVIPLYTHPAPSWQGLSDDEKLVRKWKDAYKIHD